MLCETLVDGNTRAFMFSHQRVLHVYWRTADGQPSSPSAGARQWMHPQEELKAAFPFPNVADEFSLQETQYLSSWFQLTYFQTYLKIIINFLV